MPEQSQPETTRFFNRMMGLPRYLTDKRFGTALRTLLDWLDRIARLEGALERSFRPREGKGLALPIDKGPLRLYCYRFNDRALLLCGGGIKSAQTVQESPDCLPHFTLMNQVVQALQRQRITPELLPANTTEVFAFDLEIPDDEYAG